MYILTYIAFCRPPIPYRPTLLPPWVEAETTPLPLMEDLTDVQFITLFIALYHGTDLYACILFVIRNVYSVPEINAIYFSLQYI